MPESQQPRRRARDVPPRNAMPERPADERVTDFCSVNLGFSEDLAAQEADRCLQCANPPCIKSCPVTINIPAFIAAIANGDIRQAHDIITQDNLFPAICGRVCPQEVQCEGSCVMARKYEPVAIGHLERFVADTMRTGDETEHTEPPPRTGKRIAVVGSGPAGLACAGDLARSGHDVTVFEALHELGGVLIYGIPAFRLPKDIVAAEIGSLERLGVVFERNVAVGKTVTVSELLNEESFDAVFIGTGAGTPRMLDIEGEDAIGVYSANEFLTRINLMHAHESRSMTPMLDMTGKFVLVFGGGNTAMDSARTAKRLGAEHVVIVYRRSEAEMPARREEIIHAREEGIAIHTLNAPCEFLSDEKGRLVGVRMHWMDLGPEDTSGRRSVTELPGSEYEWPADIAIVAVGNRPNPILRDATPALAVTSRGTVAADAETGETSIPGVFAGGDAVSGGATVISAMGAGRRAARAIETYLADGHGQQTKAKE